MRFIHAADLHIDSPLRGLSRYEGAPLERLRGATRRALERLVELAIDEKVDFVLIAGDLYDRDWQDFHTGLFVRDQMARLAKAEIRVFLVQGNHDAHGVITRQVPWPANVKLFSSRAAETVRIDELNVAVHGQSFADREVPEDLVPGYPDGVTGYFNIGVLHTSLTGAVGHDTYAPTSIAALQAKGYDYWALGHIHARQVVCAEPRVVFPGNLQGRHALETGPKGCELVTVVGSTVDARFVPLDVVRWHQIQFDLSPIRNIDDLPGQLLVTLQAAVAGAGDVLHAVRVLLVGETHLHATEAQQPGTLAAAVRSAAQDVIDAEIWVEQVRLSLSSPIDRSQLSQGNDALGELVRLVDMLKSDERSLEAFCRDVLSEVYNRIPAEVTVASSRDTGSEEIPKLNEAKELMALIMDAEATLLARLSSGGTQL